MTTWPTEQILIVGDTHCSKTAVCEIAEYMKRRPITRVVVVGDFGYWPALDEGQSFLSLVSQVALSVGTPWYFIDGNHDDHDELGRVTKGRFDQMFAIRPGLEFIPRGHRWEWGSTSFGALGGAFSIDRSVRMRGVDWFEQEVVSLDDVAALGDEKLDILLTHEAPLGFEPIRPIEIPGSVPSRERVREAMVATRPGKLIHGHWHVRRSQMFADYRSGFNTEIVGLAAASGDFTERSFVELAI